MAEHEVPLEELQEHMHHSAHEGGVPWISAVALSTAILATLAAVAALNTGYCESEEMKTHTEEYDHWAQYQAKGIKKEIYKSKVDILAVLKGESVSEKDKTAAIEKSKAAIAKYDVEQKELMEKAKETHELSDNYGKAQKMLAKCVTLFQVAIAIGAIAVLTRKKPFWYVSLLFGAGGIALLVIGLTSVPAEPKEPEGEKAKTEEKAKGGEEKKGEAGAENKPAEEHKASEEKK
jgi:hypothetical protein